MQLQRHQVGSETADTRRADGTACFQPFIETTNSVRMEVKPPVDQDNTWLLSRVCRFSFKIDLARLVDAGISLHKGRIWGYDGCGERHCGYGEVMTHRVHTIPWEKTRRMVQAVKE